MSDIMVSWGDTYHHVITQDLPSLKGNSGREIYSRKAWTRQSASPDLT
jgi:hypothetical protein